MPIVPYVAPDSSTEDALPPPVQGALPVPATQAQGALPARQGKSATSEYDSLIDFAAEDNGVDPNLIRAMMHQESGGKPGAVSNKGAGGLMQLMPATAERFGVKNRFDPADNINGAAKYIRFLQDKFNGDVPLMLAGYNAGEHAVEKYGNTVPPYAETQDYVSKIMSRYEKMKGGAKVGGILKPGEWQEAPLQRVAQEGAGPTWGDRGAALMAGMANIPTTVGTGLEMAGRATGIEPLEDIGHYTREVGSNAEDYWQSQMTEEGRNPATWWGKISQASLQSLPGVLTMAIPSIGAAGLLTKLGGGMVSATQAGTAASAAVEGVYSALQNAAQTGDEVRDVNRTPQAQLEAHPFFQRAMEMANGDIASARELIARSAEIKTFQTTLPWTAGTSALTGGGLLGTVAGRAAGAASKGFLREAGETARKEGAQEAIQSAGEQAIQNYVAQQRYDAGRDLLQGTGEQAIVGGGAGALLGGIGGGASHFMGGETPAAPAVPPAAPVVPPAVPPAAPVVPPVVPPAAPVVPPAAPVVPPVHQSEVDLLNPVPAQQEAAPTAILSTGEEEAAGPMPVSEIPIAQTENVNATPTAESLGIVSGAATEGDRTTGGGEQPNDGSVIPVARGLGEGVPVEPVAIDVQPAPVQEAQAGNSSPEPVGALVPDFIPENKRSFIAKRIPELKSKDQLHGYVRTLTGGTLNAEQKAQLNQYYDEVKGNAQAIRGNQKVGKESRQVGQEGERNSGGDIRGPGKNPGGTVAPSEGTQAEVTQNEIQNAERGTGRTENVAEEGTPGGTQGEAPQEAVKKSKAARKAKKAAQPPNLMPASEINKALDKLDEKDSALTDELIAAGRGHDKAQDIMKGSDEFARRMRENYEARSALRAEIESRMGPGATSRLPKGFGPLKHNLEAAQMAAEKVEEPPAFSRTAEEPSTEKPKHTPESATANVAGKLGKGMENLINKGVINFTAGKESWPEAARKTAKPSDKGVYVNGKAYIDLQQTSEEEIHQVVLHEIGEHHNLKQMIGEKAYSGLQNQIKTLNAHNDPTVSKAWAEVTRDYDHLTPGSEAHIAEVIVKVGQRAPNTPWYKRLLSSVKAFLLRVGLARGLVNKTITAADLHALLRTSVRATVADKTAPRILNDFAPSQAQSKEYGPAIGKALDQANEYVQRWAKELGIDAPPVVLDDSIAGQGAYYPSSNKNNRVIKLRSSVLSRLEGVNARSYLSTIEVLAHEFGHHIAETALKNAEEATRAAVADDYAQWAMDNYGDTIPNILANRMTPMRASVAGMSSEEALKGAGIDRQYALSENEWLADQAARFLLSKEMSGAFRPETKSIIRKLADNLKAMWEKVKDQLDPRSASLDAFLQGLVDRSVALRVERSSAPDAPPMFSRSPAELAGNARDLLSDMLNSPGTFNIYHKTVSTQFNKAMASEAFSKFWTRTDQMYKAVNRAISRPADMAPTILPKFDISNWWEAFKSVGGVSKVHDADFKAVHSALMAGTFHGGPSPTTGRVFSDAELRAGIVTPDGATVKLTDEQVKLYHEARNAVNASVSEVAAAQAWTLARKHIKDPDLREFVSENPLDAPQVLRDALDQLAEKSREEIDTLQTAGLRKNKDGVPVKTLEKRLADMEDTQKRIAKIFAQSKALQDAGYMPAHRFGRYRVAVTFEGGPKGSDTIRYVAQYESAFEANRARRELMKQFPESGRYEVGEVTEMDPDKWKMYRGIDPETIMLFADQAGIPTDEIMQEWYKEAVSNRSALTRLAHRKGYAGYSQDLPRSLAAFTTSNGKFAGTAYHMADLQEAMGKEKDTGVAIEERKLLEAIGNTDNTSDFASKARSLMATWYLLGSPASAIINSFQPVMQTAPWLYAHGGKSVKHSFGLLVDAYKQIRKGTYDRDLADAVERAERDGTISASEVYHLYQEAMKPMLARFGGGETAKRINAAMFIWGAPFSMAENLNRKATFIAAFNAGREQGMDAADSFRHAELAVVETQGVYAIHNRPNWAREGFGSLAFTFRQFTINYLEQLNRMARSGPQGRRAAALQLGILFFFGGLAGAPGEGDLEDAVDTLAQTLFGKAFVSRVALRQALEKNLGKELAGFAQHGISEFLPVDVSGRFGLGNIIPGTAVLKPSEKRPFQELAEFFGPAGATVNNIVEASRMAAGEGEVLRAIRMSAPKAIGDVLKGIEMAQTGEARNAYGGKLAKASAMDAIFQAAGFQPAGKAKEAAIRYPLQELLDYRNKMESSIASRIARGMADNNYTEVAKARRRMQDWNRANPKMRIEISGKQLKSRVENLKMSASEKLAKTAAPEVRAGVQSELDSEEE